MTTASNAHVNSLFSLPVMTLNLIGVIGTVSASWLELKLLHWLPRFSIVVLFHIHSSRNIKKTVKEAQRLQRNRATHATRNVKSCQLLHNVRTTARRTLFNNH